jgi:pimeloyl-ACP methyl ester carboxylesterase
MRNLTSWDKRLKRDFVVANGVRTAIFRPSKQLGSNILLVHGINGSHYGLVGLAKRLSDNGGRPILLDLPGHGDSEVPTWFDIENLRRWFSEIYQQISSGRRLDVAAHSFGCYAVTPERADLTFICPAPTKNPVVQLAPEVADVLFRVQPLIKIYDWQPFSYRRGIALLHDKNPANRQAVADQAAHDVKTTAKQRRFQTKLAKALPLTGLFDNISPTTVVMGRYDKLMREDTPDKMQAVFNKAKIVQLDSGHMPNIECVDQLAEILLSKN